MDIGIYNALFIFCNPNGLHIQIEKNNAGNYGMAFHHESSVICRWEPFSSDVGIVLNQIERVLKMVIVYGRLTYLTEGTFLYNWYNVARKILPEDLVLSHVQVEGIVANLKHQVEHPKPKSAPSSPETEVFVGAIVPQGNSLIEETYHV
ncbi:MAG: hypothetical protein UU98_C0003G0031 [Parcubacteria group bacterium GW2011_GWD2_42_14]|nr:MAG: hypothetical protein UU98_C0003G0031 [Parcubacteria group bacterium GW2011_GWD2_42_14]